MNFKKMKILFLATIIFVTSATAYLSIPDRNCIHGYATLENARGQDGTAKYSNQDRVLLKKLSQNQIILGVFDGHGKKGDVVASFVSTTLADLLQEDPLTETVLEDANDALQAELETDEDAWASGTTAVFGVLERDQLIVSNTGDSRLLIARNGGQLFTTVDHKPTTELEYNRIAEAGGTVIGHYVYDIDHRRGLALSRSLGDVSCHRNNIVIAKPQIDCVQIKPNDIIIAASDGLFDVMNNDEVIQFVHRAYWCGYNITKIAEYLVQKARDRGSRDDITAVILVVN